MALNESFLYGFEGVRAYVIRWLVLGTLQAKEAHRAYLESLPSTTYPLEPTGDPAEVNERQRVSDEPFGQR